MYYVYILYSESGDRYYKGMSQNPENRLEYHNTKEKGYTSRYRPWKLVWKQKYDTKQEALSVEQKLKKWKSRKMIERVIRGEIDL